MSSPSDDTSPPPEARTPALLERFQAGDRESYEVLFRRYRKPLMRFIRRHTDERFLAQVPADDLFQEVHLEAIKGIGSFRRELSFFFWLCGITRNLIRNHCRRLRRRPPDVSAHTPVEGASTSSVELLATVQDQRADPERRAVLEQHLHLVATAMEELPPRRSRAVLLRHFEGYSNKEVAEIMGISQKASSALVIRGVEQLHDRLAFLFGEQAEPGASAD